MSKSIKLKNDIYWDTTSYSKILYDNPNGTQSDFTLSDTIANYKYIEVMYGRENWGSCPNSSRKGKVYNNGNMVIHLDYIYGYSSNTIDFSTTSLNINSKNVSFDNARTMHSTINTYGDVFCENRNVIEVFRVIGYN